MNPRRARLKRWALKLTLCLLAGAVVTWGVATLSPYASLEGSLERTVRLEAQDGSISAGIHRSARYCDTWYVAPTPPDNSAPLLTRPGWVYTVPGASRDGGSWALGFPFRALVIRIGVVETAALPFQFIVDGGVRFNHAGGWHLIPLDVLPLGFTLNTLLAAGLVLGVVEGVRLARRRLRRKRGRCPACGYDRRGLAEGAACPECGEVS